jgi:antitoxin component of MazEF toxin-antitoxin module
MPLIDTKAKRVGGSLMITLPKHLVDLIGIKEGDTLQVRVEFPRKDLFGALRGVGKFTPADHADHE